MRAAQSGEPLQDIGVQNLPDLTEEVLAGLFICSHNEDVSEQGQAWNVRIDRPVADDYNPYQAGFLSSRLEVMDVFNGRRKVIHTMNPDLRHQIGCLMANKLLFNQEGSLYTIDLDGQHFK